LKYSVIAEAYEKIEATTKRLEMTDLLDDLLRNTPKDLIERVAYLTQGKLYPDFLGVEIGVAEKLALKALARATGNNQAVLEEDLRKSGDIGETGQRFISSKRQVTFFQEALTVEKVYETLDKVAKTSGSGAVDAKMALLAGLLAAASPLEAKYVLRTVTGNLRLGIADMTVLDALALAYGGGKDAREFIERAYNVCCDLGRVARVLVEKGLDGIRRFEVSVGEPIRPMLAERLSSPEEILEKLGGRCVAEYKYDGERLQAHKRGDEVTLFSRRVENISSQYPDAVKLFRGCVEAKEAILECECVAVDVDTGEMRPFQELMHRRRKYGVEEAVVDYPVSLFVFDALFVDGRDLTLEPFPVRRRCLEETVQVGDRVRLAKNITTGDAGELERFFLEAIEDGCEGLVCKSVGEDSVYQAGARGWLWIKYKRDYKSEMKDTVDLVVVGAFHGRGKRAGTYGALLLASYDAEADTFETVTKCGTGFTDEDLAKLPRMLARHEVKKRSVRVDSVLEADVWFEPWVVLEVLGAEVTLSPIHTCALGSVREGSGLAIRFPRFTGNYRVDRAPEDATTSAEILEMYRGQLKKMSEAKPDGAL
jgi:DNA ligase-1